jgi:hypothetical protein
MKHRKHRLHVREVKKNKAKRPSPFYHVAAMLSSQQARRQFKTREEADRKRGKLELGAAEAPHEQPCLTSPLSAIQPKSVRSSTPLIISVKQARELMAYVETFEGGRFAFLYALMLFAGIRSDLQHGEIRQLCDEIVRSGPDSVFINGNSVIRLAERITQSKYVRWIHLPENLKAWIRCYPPVPENLNLRALRGQFGAIRKKFNIPPYGLRRSCISYYATMHSLEEAAIYAGFSTLLIRQHLFNPIKIENAKEFWSIVPVLRSGPRAFRSRGTRAPR